MSTLENKTVVIIGAGGGFGQAIVPELAAQGATLALGSPDIGIVEKLAESALDKGATSVFAKEIDVVSEDSVAAFFQSVGQQYDQADVLIYLPGLSIPAQVTEMSSDDYDKVIDVNLKGLFLSAKHYFPLTDPERDPMMLFISSQAATRANPNAPVYCAAKAAVSMFGQALALQAMERNIRVTAIKPGPVDTRGFWGDRPVPREKFMQASDVAQVVEFVLGLPSHIVMHEISFESFNFFKK